MRVNKVELKNWLRTKIESLSISDPIPLSKYIAVLVSKDKPENELKAFCIDQLEELLGDNTNDFVEEMFAVALTSGEDVRSASDTQTNEERVRRMQGKHISKTHSPISNSPEKIGRSHQRSPLSHKSHSPLDDQATTHRGRHSRNPSCCEGKRHHDPHEYIPDFENKATSLRRRSRSGHSDAEDNESHRDRSVQRLDRLSQNSDRPRDRSSRVDRFRGGKQDCSDGSRHPRRRCRNFDERGFCIYGDRCKFDHGVDAVVFPGCPAAVWTSSLLNNALATGACLIPRTSPSRVNGLLDNGSDVQPTPAVEQEDIDSNGLPIYNPTPIAGSVITREPVHSFRPRTGIVNKNIIPIPMGNSGYETPSSARNRHDPYLSPPVTPPAYEPARPEISDGNVGGEILDETGTTATAEYTPSPIAQQQCSLLVTKLPWRLNDVKRLREHFGRFGNLINIHTCFCGQSSQALVTYSMAAEAEAAYRSPEPILSNRFIRLSMWPNNNINFGSGRIGGKFQGPGFKRYGETPEFSRFGQSLLGDAQPVSSRLSAKFRLGDVTSSSSSSLKRSRLVNSCSNMPKTPLNRSRWRLERDEDGNPVNAEDEDEEIFEEDLDEHEKKRMRTSEIEEENSLVSIPWHSAIGSNEDAEFATTAAIKRKKARWECQKAAALKEHQRKLLQLEKQRAARQQELLDRKAQIAHLSAELKDTIASLENECDLKSKRSLLAKTNVIFKELEDLKRAQVPAKRGIADAMDDTKQQQQAAVQKLLPDSVATERLEKIAEVKQQLAELDIHLQEAANETAESQAKLRRKATELKRKLVDLETIRASDLAAINATSNLPIRGQTKLDKRPRILYVTGHSTYDVKEFRHALAMNYLYTESFRTFFDGTENQPVIEITFCTRDFAEAAVRMFPHFRGRRLVMSFTPPVGLTQQPSLSSEKTTLSDKSNNLENPTASASGDTLCTMEEELIAPVVDATVDDEFRSPKKTITSPVNSDFS